MTPPIHEPQRCGRSVLASGCRLRDPRSGPPTHHRCRQHHGATANRTTTAPIGHNYGAARHALVLRTLIVRSPAPVANHWFPGSTVTDRGQPTWPLITRMSFHGACHLGFGTFMGLRRATMARLWFWYWGSGHVGTWSAEHTNTTASRALPLRTALSAPSCAAALYATKLVDTTGLIGRGNATR